MFGFLSKKKKPRIHFLHIGKTGGSAVKAVLKDFTETPMYSLELHNHKTSLKDVPKGESAIFFLRDPVSRFISGFYSRQRKGLPRYLSEWNADEKKVYEHFATPNALAGALANEQAGDHALALLAMKSVQHLVRYKQWYIDFDYFRSRAADIPFVGFQESLDADFAALKTILEIPPDTALPTDDVGAHRNPKDLDKKIDEVGMRALRAWYADDFTFVSMCRELMAGRPNTLQGRE